MPQKKYGILLDTETLQIRGKTLIYDIAWIVIDTQGNILSRNNYLISEMFNDFPAMFDSPFVTYEKYQTYKEMVRSGKVRAFSCARVMRQFAHVIEKNNISFVTAYNLNFDLKALKETTEYFNVFNPLVNANLTYIDLWQLSKSLIVTNPYKKHCQSKGWLTEKRKQPKTTAETIYRWIAKNDSFIESHTALADCEIEVIIYRKCKQKKKKIPENAYIAFN